MSGSVLERAIKCTVTMGGPSTLLSDTMNWLNDHGFDTASSMLRDNVYVAHAMDKNTAVQRATLSFILSNCILASVGERGINNYIDILCMLPTNQPDKTWKHDLFNKVLPYAIHPEVGALEYINTIDWEKIGNEEK